MLDKLLNKYHKIENHAGQDKARYAVYQLYQSFSSAEKEKVKKEIGSLLEKIKAGDKTAIEKGCILATLNSTLELIYVEFRYDWDKIRNAIHSYFPIGEKVNMAHVDPERRIWTHLDAADYLLRKYKGDDIDNYIVTKSGRYRMLHWQDVPWTYRFYHYKTRVKDLPSLSIKEPPIRFFNTAGRVNPSDPFSIPYEKGIELMIKMFKYSTG